MRQYLLDSAPHFGEDFGEALKGFRKAMAEPEDLPPTTSPASPGHQEPQGIVEEQARSSSSDLHKT
jgi:hypothetical protein